MNVEGNLRVSWRARPRGFVALMGLYESNYLRFAQLAGEPRAVPQRARSCVPGDCELLLEIVERSPYTTVADLTYLLPPEPAADGASGLRLPDLRLRIYHDARLVEAGWRSEAGATERELHHRWARNVMLNKWLEYCLDRGHRLLPPVA
ncbi:MAG: DUF1249 domain-containing protein [Gammaproteobacteria bacterium]|nr:DUF1249 domain-containing protein [Gammaproteobacteria bacterium]